jgi:hypothetical protein
MTPVGECLKEEHVVAPNRVNDLRCVGVVHGHRLLAQHMLAGVGRTDRPLPVPWVMRCDVHDVDIPIAHQAAVARMVVRDVEFRGESRSTLGVAACGGDERAVA